jgi:hypothetical protein
LKPGVWFLRGRLLMVSPVRGNYRRCQAEIPLIALCRFPGPAHQALPSNLRLPESLKRPLYKPGTLFGPVSFLS